MLTPADGPALLPVYATFPLRAVAGHGSWLVDEAGDEWLDAYGGHAVATCGHSHPDVVRAIAEQAATLIFYSTAVPHAGRERLAAAIAARAPGRLGKVFFCNSGAEANENLVGLARRKTGRGTVVTMRGGWHGRSRGWHHDTGNVAFDDWRKAELERIEEERRKLDAMREEFDNYLRELRRAKDQEEFDRFMRDRNNRPPANNDHQNGFSG